YRAKQPFHLGAAQDGRQPHANLHPWQVADLLWTFQRDTIKELNGTGVYVERRWLHLLVVHQMQKKLANFHCPQLRWGSAKGFAELPRTPQITVYRIRAESPKSEVLTHPILQLAHRALLDRGRPSIGGRRGPRSPRTAHRGEMAASIGAVLRTRV